MERQNIMDLHYVPDKELLHDILCRREIQPISEKNAYAFSTLSGHRSGLFDLYRHYGFEMPSELSNALKKDFKGVRRTVAQDVKVSSGKDPLSF